MKGKTALITGASSGIGKACAEQFAALGMNLVLTARRLDRVENIAAELESKHKIKAYPLELDVQKLEQVEALHEELNKKKIEIDILVNNAGLALGTDLIQEGNIDDWEIMIDTNIKGLLYVTRTFVGTMIKRNQGHIINIGSVAGHGTYPRGNIYCMTKHAVRAISESLRIDLMGTPIRVSEIDPGAVHTEFSEVRWKDKEKADKFYEGFAPLYAKDIADAVAYCVTRPPHVNIAEMLVYPQAQASLRDIYRPGESLKSLFDAKK